MGQKSFTIECLDEELLWVVKRIVEAVGGAVYIEGLFRERGSFLGTEQYLGRMRGRLHDPCDQPAPARLDTHRDIEALLHFLLWPQNAEPRYFDRLASPHGDFESEGQKELGEQLAL